MPNLRMHAALLVLTMCPTAMYCGGAEPSSIEVASEDDGDDSADDSGGDSQSDTHSTEDSEASNGCESISDSDDCDDESNCNWEDECLSEEGSGSDATNSNSEPSATTDSVADSQPEKTATDCDVYNYSVPYANDCNYSADCTWEAEPDLDAEEYAEQGWCVPFESCEDIVAVWSCQGKSKICDWSFDESNKTGTCTATAVDPDE